MSFSDGLPRVVARRKPPEDQSGVRGAAVSVVIPCYNYGRFLPQAVGSVLSQDDVVVDVVVVDDASSDDSFAVAQELAAQDSRVTVVGHRQNAGPVQTFNDGLTRAHGEFLVRLDADDLLTPGSLARAVAVMREYPSVGLVYGHPLHFSGSVPPRARTTAKSWTIWQGHKWLKDRCTDGWCVITSPEAVMRASVVHRVGGQKNLAHTHDMEMWMRLAAYADVAYVHGADQAWHRDHPQSLSATKVNTFRDLLERKDAYDMVRSGVANDVPEMADFHALAMKALAEQAVEYASRELDHGRNDQHVLGAYLDFIRSVVEDPDLILGWKGLAQRLDRGQVRGTWHPSSVFARANRWWRRRRRERRWHREGVY